MKSAAQHRPEWSRIGILGDVHCESAALRHALRHFREQSVNAVLCVGDLVDGAGDVNLTLSILEDEGVLAVAGNHDRALLAAKERHLRNATPVGTLTARAERYLRALPAVRELETPLGLLLLCHGLADDDLSGIEPDTTESDALALPAFAKLLSDARHSLMVNGHTHRPMVRRFHQLTIINAGTLHADYRPVCSLLDFQTRTLNVWDLRPHLQPAARWPLESKCEFLPTP